jgi:hypothetical protein
MRILGLFFLSQLITTTFFLYGQTTVPDSLKLFDDETPLEVIIKTDQKKLLGKKPKVEYMGADITWRMPDSTLVSERIRVRARGNFRRGYCYVPPLKFNFHNKTSPILYPLDELELTCSCRPGDLYDQLVYKEYLVYRIYNVITVRSQRVRIVNLTIEDSAGKKKTVNLPAFLIEDLDDVASRNDCKEIKIEKLHTENTDRQQMTLVALFEFMIGNTDWSVYANHNIKFITEKQPAVTKPYAIAYDFDYAGLVNAPYAVPEPALGISSVTERLYRGFPRSIEELQEVSKIFVERKDSIYSMIENFKLLQPRHKSEMKRYLDEFYYLIADPRRMKKEFIDNARQM